MISASIFFLSLSRIRRQCNPVHLKDLRMERNNFLQTQASLVLQNGVVQEEYWGGSIWRTQFGKRFRLLKWESQNLRFYDLSQKILWWGQAGAGQEERLVEMHSEFKILRDFGGFFVGFELLRSCCFFFCWRLLGLIPGGTPFSQLNRGVRDAMSATTKRDV